MLCRMPVFVKLDRTEVSPPGVPKIRGHPESRKIGMPMRFTRPLSLVSQNRQEGQIGIGSDSRPDHSPVDHSLNVGFRLDVMDVSRRLRVRAVIPRVRSASSRNAITSGASMSSSAKVEGALPRRLCTNCSSILKVSRYEAIVCALAWRCCIRRWVKNRSRRTLKLG